MNLAPRRSGLCWLLRCAALMGFALLVGLGAAARAAEADPALEAALEPVRQAIASKNYSAALALAQAATQRFPQASEAWRLKGSAVRLNGDPRGALADYSKAITLDPRNVIAWGGRAQARLGLRDYQAALADVNAALAIDPQHANTLAIRADIRSELGDAVGALVDATAAMQLKPQQASYAYSRMYAHYKLKNWQAVVADANLVLQLDPQFTKAVHFARGIALAELGRHEEAITDFELAMAAGHQPEAAAVRKKRSEVALQSAAATVAQAPQPTQPAPARPPAAEPLRDTDRPWAAAPLPAVQLKAALPALAIRPPLDLKHLTAAQYQGAVSAAMEAMRLVQEPMSPQETAQFERKWAPLFQFPTAEAVKYFNQLNPLLDEFLMLRGVIASSAAAVDEAWSEAHWAARYESETGTRAAMAIVAHHTGLLQSAQSRLAGAVRQITALGNPPSPVAAQEAARKRHEDAAVQVREILPTLAVTPARRECAAGAACVFNPKGTHLPPGVSLEWTFGDGQTARGDLASVQHVYAKEGRYLVQVTAVDTRRQPVARARAQMSVGKAAAQSGTAGAGAAWVLTRIERKPLGPSDFGMGPIPMRTENLDTSFAVDAPRGPLGKPVVGKVSWSLPPSRLKPHDPIVVPWQVSGADPRRETVRFGVKIIHFFENIARPDLTDDGIAYIDLRKPAGEYRLARGLEAPKERFNVIRSYQIEIRAEMGGMHEVMGYGNSFVGHSVILHYSFDPTGAQAPANEQGDGAMPEAAADPASQAKAQAIAEHRANIAAIERFMAGDREALGRASDARARAALEARLLTAQADIQAEKDLIASLETGQYVHTRTEYDEATHAQFVRNIEQQQRQLGTILKIMDRSERLVALAPPTEQARLRDFARRQLSPELIASMDLAKARQAMEAIGGQVQGHYQGEAARQEEKAAWADFGHEAASNLQSAADAGMMVTSLVGGPAINLAYQAGMGYIEGGPREAILRAATTYSDAIDYAATAYDGYQRGGLAGASQDLAWKVVQDKSLAWVAGKLQRAGSGAPRKAQAELAEQFEAAKFNQDRKLGEALVQDFQRSQRALQEAGRSGAPAQTLQRLQAEVRDKASAVASSLHAKNFLKYKSDADTGRAYDAHMRAVHAEVDARLKEQMRKEGWNTDEWELQEFRNAASYGKPNMDRDIGLREKPLWELDAQGRPKLDANDRPIPNPERWQQQAGRLVPKPQVTKDGRPMTLHQWQTEASAAYQKAYRATTRRSAAMAMEGITTSMHPEAYKDLGWLQDNKALVQASWAGQAADVTRYKVHAPEHADPTAARFTKLQEVARGTGKDIETKLLPVLQNAQPMGSTPAARQSSEQRLAQARAHWQEINSVLSAFGRNDIDPIHATRRIRELTGGRTIAEVADQMGALLEGTLKLGQ